MKYDDSIDGNVVVEDEFAQGFDMTGILPDRIPQLVLLGGAVTFIAPVRQVLLPELGIPAAIYLPVYILCLYDKDSVAREDDMVDLCCVVSVLQQ